MKTLLTPCVVSFFAASERRELGRGELAAKAVSVCVGVGLALWCLGMWQGWVKATSWAFFFFPF